MNHRPIIFSTPMVQAIMEGRKLMTRRKLGNLYKNETPEHEKAFLEILEHSPEYIYSQCPYGKKGDLLWVRETFDPTGCMGSILYKASYSDEELKQAAKGVFKWKPSIHMPKKAARIWLQIEDVKVERLHDITNEDAVMEGIELNSLGNYKSYLYKDASGFETPRYSFFDLWQSINGIYSLEENPWVWVIVFTKIPKPEFKNISPEEWYKLSWDELHNPNFIYRTCVENK